MIVEIHVKNIHSKDIPGGGVAKNPPANAGDTDSIPWLRIEPRTPAMGVWSLRH